MRPQPFTRNHRELSKSECGNSDPSQGRGNQLVAQCQTVIRENIYESGIICIQQVLFRNIYIYVYSNAFMYGFTINQTWRPREYLKETREVYMRGFEGRKWKGEL